MRLTPDQPVAQQNFEPAPGAPAVPAAVAPAWHTLLFLLIIIGFAALSADSQGRMIQKHGRVSSYLLTMGWEYLLVGYIAWGARKKGVSLRQLIGGRWPSLEKFLADLGIGFVFWIIALGVLAGVSYALRLTSPAQVEQAKKQLGPLLPRTGFELGLWIALSATAGFCEEIMFRGYLQKQVRALTRSSALAVVAQGLVFGVAHSYQGGRRIFLIGVYGALFGILALWRKSLRPGMIGHMMQDSFSGLAFRLLK
jgi:membrane protease YdiL (CAAX protease family)